MDLKTISLDRNGPVGLITLRRPHRNNAWTGRMHTEYRWALEQAEDDHDVRVVVVTGEGNSFCVGADRDALEGHVERGGYDPGTPDPLARPGYGVHAEFDASFAYHFGLTKPVIAAINGATAGVGLVLACFTDLRYAVPGAVMTGAHGRLALSAEYGLSWLLPRLIGLSRATEVLLTSRRFTTDEACEWGLVHGLHDREALLPAVLARAKEMAEYNSRRGLAETKRTLYLDQHRDAATAVREAERLVPQLMTEPDFHRGVAALVGRRSPEFE